MTIPADKQGPAVFPPLAGRDFVSPEPGGIFPLSGWALSMLERMAAFLNGQTPLFPCNAEFDSNLYTLTPTAISPKFLNYADYQSFAFVAPATSTGLITATVVPEQGSIGTLPVYKDDGGTQATTNDIRIDRFYIVFYVDSLNAGNGGFVLK